MPKTLPFTARGGVKPRLDMRILLWLYGTVPYRTVPYRTVPDGIITTN